MRTASCVPGREALGGTTFTMDFGLPEPGADKYISVVPVAQACGALQKVHREEEEDGPTGMEGWPQGKGTAGGHLREARGRPSLSHGQCLQPLSLHAGASPEERFPTLTSQQAAPRGQWTETRDHLPVQLGRQRG